MRVGRYFFAAIFCAATLWAATGCDEAPKDLLPPDDGTAFYEVRVLDSIPHDDEAFTQGLLFRNGHLYESTGLVGRSSLREIDAHTGEILRNIDVPDVFAEGLAFCDGKLFQITYRDLRALVYDARDLRLVDEFAYAGEGWGLTFDGESLVMSDGSADLTFRDPQTFAPRRRARVTLSGEPVEAINELEFIDKLLWANIWRDDRILMIRPADGVVVGVIDASQLVARQSPGSGVLNGIAYDPATGAIYLTGKNWSWIYRVELVKTAPQGR